MTDHDFALVQETQEIIAKTAKLVARHDHLRSLLLMQLRQLTPDTEADILLTLAEADRCVKQILALMEEMEGLCERSAFFEQQASIEAGT